MNRLTHSVGVCKEGEFKRYIGNKQTKEYALWVNMLKRCYSKKFHKQSPQYIGCTVSENFKNFQYFAEWCNRQIGFNTTGYHLDKDILVKGNKHYSEETCVFVPKDINYFFLRRTTKRGNFPIGVCQLHGKFKAQISIKSRVTALGLFDSEIEAFNIYKSAKENLAKVLAQEVSGIVDSRVVSSLENFTVEITD